MRNVSSDDPQEPFGDAYPLKRFEHLAHYGCSWCHDDIELGDPVVIFDSHDKILCKHCSPKIADNRTRIYLSPIKMAQAA